MLNSLTCHNVEHRTDASFYVHNHHPRSQPLSLSKKSSIAFRAEKASSSVNKSKLWGVVVVFVFSLVIVNTLAYVIVEFGIFGGSKPWKETQERAWAQAAARVGTSGSSVASETPMVNQLGITNTVPTSNLSDFNFLVYVGFIIYTTLMLSGLGLEILVWIMFLQQGWSTQTEKYWRLSQFAFPLLGLTTVGLAYTRNYLALPLMVAHLWKFGFPETVLYVYSALYDTKRSKAERIMDGMNGVGTVVHHNVCVMWVAMVLTGVLPSNRYIFEVTIPLVIQHWFVLLKYSNRRTYVVLELIGEIWFEWVALSNLENLFSAHWTGGIITGSMLFAHWLYLASGAIGLFAAPDGIEANQIDHLKNISQALSATKLPTYHSASHPVGYDEERSITKNTVLKEPNSDEHDENISL